MGRGTPHNTAFIFVNTSASCWVLNRHFTQPTDYLSLFRLPLLNTTDWGFSTTFIHLSPFWRPGGLRPKCQQRGFRSEASFLSLWEAAISWCAHVTSSLCVCWGGPNVIARVFVRGRRRVGVRGDVTMEAKGQGLSATAKECRQSVEGRSRKKDSSRSLYKGTEPANTSMLAPQPPFQTPDLHTRDIILLCCFEPLSL